MKVTDLPLTGLKLIELDVYRDQRGFFLERFNQERFASHGINEAFVQDNHSYSVPRVIRGLHYQSEKPQGKLVSVVRGRIWDVVVDIRSKSPSFGQSYHIELDAEKGHLFWIPAGFAHGFCVMGNEPADVVYKVDQLYNPQSEGGIRWDDPKLSLQWPVLDPIVSIKDRDLPSLDEYKKNPVF